MLVPMYLEPVTHPIAKGSEELIYLFIYLFLFFFPSMQTQYQL